MGYLLGNLLPRSVREVCFGSEPQKWSQFSRHPSPTTMLQGVHAGPPSLYLWAFGVLIERGRTYSRTHRCEGLHVKTEQGTMRPELLFATHPLCSK
jgi:hypothetical protein